MLNIEELFEKHDDEYIKFDRVQNPRHSRPDLCAFLMLHDLSPAKKPGRDMISSAEHDEIWLDIDVDQVAENATEEDIITLIRCGIRFDTDNWAFALFV